jgi:D-arabinonate dehydratase/D-galactarolactone cycloisomerase
MNRRTFFELAGMAASPLLAQTVETARRGVGPLKITKIDALVIRTPGDNPAPESLATMTPLGAMTGGAGIWNRLDHASPSRAKGHTQAVLVRIDTNQGLTGWGECHAPEAPRVHKTIVTDLVAPVLTGQDALEVEPLWEKLYSTERLRGYSTGFYTEAIAGVDLALWDLLGQFAGLPVYRLLGGKYRDRIPSYEGIGGASIADLKSSASKAVDEGFNVVKIGFSKGAGTNDIARVAAVSEVMRKGQVLVDSLGAFKLYEAVKLGRELDRIGNVGWWEDPLMPDDLTSYPKLADALDTAICAGEELCNRFQFADFLAAKSADIINPDVCRAGGISEVKRIATLADAHGVMWAPHISTGTALYVAASMHLAAATPNLIISEGGRALAGPLGNELLEEPIDWKPGWIGVPDKPGLGVRFKPSALAKVTAGENG